MIKREISPQEFEKYLREFVGRELSDFYYIIDSLLVFKSGKKFKDGERIIKGKNMPIEKSEYVLRINAPWKYEREGQVIETSIPFKDEGEPSFRKRVGDFAETIHPKKIIDIKISEDGKTAEVFLDIGGKFIVSKREDQFVSYSNRYYGKKGNFIKARHVRPEEKTGKLFYFEAQKEDKLLFEKRKKAETAQKAKSSPVNK